MFNYCNYRQMYFMYFSLLITIIITTIININDSNNTIVLCNPIMNGKDLQESSSSAASSSSLESQSTASHMNDNNNEFSAENDEWKNVLKKMTEKNPCGSHENYTMCAQCGQWTGNEDAFYLCCLNLDGVREYCFSFINYDLDVEQRKRSK